MHMYLSELSAARFEMVRGVLLPTPVPFLPHSRETRVSGWTRRFINTDEDTTFPHEIQTKKIKAEKPARTTQLPTKIRACEPCFFAGRPVGSEGD